MVPVWKVYIYIIYCIYIIYIYIFVFAAVFLGWPVHPINIIKPCGIVFIQVVYLEVMAPSVSLWVLPLTGGSQFPSMSGASQREVQALNLCWFWVASSWSWITWIWPNYSDLTRPHPKWWFSKGTSLISGKSRLVKYYNLARWIKDLSCFVSTTVMLLFHYLEANVSLKRHS